LDYCNICIFSVASQTAAIDEEAYEKADKYQSDQKEPTSRVMADKSNQVRKSRNTNRSSTTSSCE
jgi:hypothetical protein